MQSSRTIYDYQYNLTVKLVKMQNQQNIDFFTTQSLDLNFKKSKNNKGTIKKFSKTDRNNNQSTIIPQGLKSQRCFLIQKKKNYSDAIRQRNLNLLAKKKVDHQSNYQIQTQSKQEICIRDNFVSPKLKQRNISHSYKKKESSNVRQSSRKRSYSGASILDLQPIPFISEYSQFEGSQQKLTKVSSKAQQKIHKKQQKNTKTLQNFIKQTKSKQQKKVKSNLHYCPNVYNEKISISGSDSSIIARQNETFKKDLVNLKKQNNKLKGQLKKAQNYIQQLQEKTKRILQDNQKQDYSLLKEETNNQEHSVDNNTEQIIQKLRGQIQVLKSYNSGLQLKAHMAEKKALQQVNICKKKMAKQLHEWRDKCTKLRAQNLKYRSLRDVTISMQISKDQQ